VTGTDPEGVVPIVAATGRGRRAGGESGEQGGDASAGHEADELNEPSAGGGDDEPPIPPEPPTGGAESGEGDDEEFRRMADDMVFMQGPVPLESPEVRGHRTGEVADILKGLQSAYDMPEGGQEAHEDTSPASTPPPELPGSPAPGKLLPPEDDAARAAFFHGMAREMYGVVDEGGIGGQPVGTTEEAIAAERARAAAELREAVLGPEAAQGEHTEAEPAQGRTPASPLLEPIPREDLDRIAAFREQLVRDAGAANMSPDEILDRLHSDPALTAAYPAVGVPEQFRQDRPGVRFTPPRIDESGLLEKRLDLATVERAMDYAHASGFTTAEITTPEQLAEWMVRARHDLAGHVPDEAIQTFVDEAVRGYLTNLELHRLVADPAGKVVRYTTTPDFDLATTVINTEAVRGKAGFNASTLAGTPPELIDPALRQQAAGTWRATWYRGEPTAAQLEQAALSGRDRVESTVGALEQNHTLALDTSAKMSLLALRNTYTP